MLEGLIDIYLPDFKYIREQDSVRYSKAKGYVDVAKAAIDEMVRQHPKWSLDQITMKKTLLKKG
jgi:putative pyruvate formate lyase activating enzyme